MTRSQMRLQLLTSVMTWRPQLDANGVQAEADVLWGWVEKPTGSPATVGGEGGPAAAVTDAAGSNPLGAAEGSDTSRAPVPPPPPVVAFGSEQVDLALIEHRAFEPSEVMQLLAPEPPPPPEPARTLAPMTAAVLAAVDARAGRAFTVADIAAAVGATISSVGHHLGKLVATGVLVAEGATNRRTWRRPDAPPVVRTDPQRLETEAAVLAELTIAAEAGAPCPTNAQLGAAIRRTPDWASDVIAMLEAQSLITVTRRGNNFRRIRIVATGAETDWSTILPDAPRVQAIERLFEAIAAAASSGAPAPSNTTLAAAAGWTDEGSTVRAINELVTDGRISIERLGKNRRRFTIVATGASTAWNELAPFGRRTPRAPELEPAPCAPADGPSSVAAEASPSDPEPTTPAPAAPGPVPSPEAFSAPSPASPPASAAPSSPPAAASAPAAAPEPSAVRLAAGPVPTPSTARREPLPPPPPKPRPALRPDEQAAIDAAVSNGMVKVVPTGATGLVQKNLKGEVKPVVPPAFRDAPDWAREAAVYLQKRNVTVVTNGPGRWLLDGRWSVSDVELVERANKKRAHQKLPPIEIPADALGKKRGRAA